VYKFSISITDLINNNIILQRSGFFIQVKGIPSFASSQPRRDRKMKTDYRAMLMEMNPDMALGLVNIENLIMNTENIRHIFPYQSDGQLGQSIWRDACMWSRIKAPLGDGTEE